MNISEPTQKGGAPLAGSAGLRTYKSSCPEGGPMMGLVSLTVDNTSILWDMELSAK